MNTQHNYMKPSPQAESAKDTRPATLGEDDGGRSTHTTCGACECVGNHSATDTPAGPGVQDWEHWEWTGGDMRLVLTMQQRRWNDTDVGHHKDMDYERWSEMVAAAYTLDDTTAGSWVLVGLWVVRNPTPDSVQQFISRWLDDGIQLASSVMRSRYDYPVFFDRILLSWNDTAKAIGHAIQDEGWRVDWEWDFNRGADGRVVLTNTKDESAPALVFVDPARCQQTGAGMDVRGGADPVGDGAQGASATDSSMPGAAVVNSPGEATAADGSRASATVGKNTGVDAGLSAGNDGTHGDSETTNTVAARRAGVGSDVVGGAENTESNGGVPTVGSRAATGDGTNHSDNVSQRGETSSTGGGMTVSNPDGGHVRDKETSCQSVSQLNNSAGVPTTRVPDEDACTLTRRGGTGTTGLGYVSASSAHSDAVAAPGGEKAGATVNGERHNSGTCATGVAGAVRGHTPAQEPTPGAPGTHGGGGSDDDPVDVSYSVPDSGFSPIVYVDYNHQEQDWFEVYGPDYTDDEGELLPDVAAAARHSIPAGGGVVPVSPGSFLQVIDVVKWWLGMDDNVGTSALGALRRAMKRNSALGD